VADDDRAAWPGIFFDGQSNRRHAIELRLAGSIEIIENGISLASWPYQDVRRVDAPAGAMRLSSVSAAPLARLELRDPVAWRDIESRCPALSGPGGVRPISVARIAAWSLVATVVIIGLIWFGVPVVADQLAEALPIGWERPLGEAVDKQVRVMFPGKPCSGPDGRAALVKLVAELQTAARLPIMPDPVVLRSSIPNAFALPGGRVYVLSALLDRAQSPDELAGVLGHEFGHVSHRDGLRRLIRDGGTAFLVGLLFGDVSGAGAALFAARSLLSAAYSRDIEAGADGFGIAVMHRLGRPTAPLGDLLKRLTGPGDVQLSLLQDHPLTPDRVRRLKQEDAAPSGPDLLDPVEWQALRRICEQR
jgi:Zn-dependent protease with chaperone function